MTPSPTLGLLRLVGPIELAPRRSNVLYVDTNNPNPIPAAPSGNNRILFTVNAGSDT